MTRIALVACGKTKLNRRAPARELCAGALFRKASLYAEVTFDKWFILSAKHHLVLPDNILDPYDLSLSDLSGGEQRDWAREVLCQLEALGLRDDDFWLLAGEKYARFLEEPLNAQRPLRGLGIGRQLAWYSKAVGA
jgi:hypothetical protein